MHGGCCVKAQYGSRIQGILEPCQYDDNERRRPGGKLAPQPIRFPRVRPSGGGSGLAEPGGKLAGIELEGLIETAQRDAAKGLLCRARSTRSPPPLSASPRSRSDQPVPDQCLASNHLVLTALPPLDGLGTTAAGPDRPYRRFPIAGDPPKR